MEQGEAVFTWTISRDPCQESSSPPHRLELSGLCLEQRCAALGCVLQKGHFHGQRDGEGAGWRQGTTNRCLSLDLEQEDDDVSQGV